MNRKPSDRPLGATPGGVATLAKAARNGRTANGAAEAAAAELPAAEAVALPSLTSLLGAAAAALGQGGAVVRESGRLVRELARVGLGKSDLAPAPNDHRFDDPAWRSSPYYRRLVKVYLAFAAAANHLVDDLEASGAEWRTVERARFVTGIAVSALAPTNAFLGNPAAIKHAFDTGGSSIYSGLRNWVDDLRHNGGMPSMVDRKAFVVGRDLAVSPGAVVDRDDIAELIQYSPTTPRVQVRPLVIVPPPIGRYYFLDLRPGRSFVEFAVNQGFTVFMVSWRNPGRAQGHWDLDTYAGRVSDAIDVACEITKSDDVNLIGFCAGGIISTTLLNHLADEGDKRVRSMSYAVTLLDFDVPAAIGAFSSAGIIGLSRAGSRRKGIIDARTMGSVFSWMRPDDLIFNYWVNNYLMGEKPPAFDLLAWNADGTNLPAALHGQFLDIFGANSLCQDPRMTVLGTAMDLSKIKVPAFVTGAINDHLTPWRGCYRTTQLLGGENRFVLSHAGHIASQVNPPGNPKASYYTGGPPGPDPDAWRSDAVRHAGSWWEPWAIWAAERSGEQRPATARLGSRRHRRAEAAPGLYVKDLVPV